MKKFFFLLLAISLSQSSYAREGFSPDIKKITPAARAWAPRTFMVLQESTKKIVGTAFLIYNQAPSAYFITAKHVLEFCNKPEVCTLRWGTPWTFANYGKEFDSKLNLKIESHGAFNRTTQGWEFAESLTDIGLIKTAYQAQLPAIKLDGIGPSLRMPLDEPKQIKIKHYILGYPYLKIRTSLKNSEVAKTVLLQFSEGAELNNWPRKSKIDRTLEAKRYLILSDADSLGGNSGSPVISKDGKLLGVLVGGQETPDQEYVEDMSYVLPIDYVKYMIGDFLSGRLKLISQD